MCESDHGELTHVAVVQTWECDSNNHLNVQFIHKRFREAGYLFRQRHGLGGIALRDAHTRFHREIQLDDTPRVFTIPVRDDVGGVFLLHRLIRGDDELLCSCLDRLATAAPGLNCARLADYQDAAPRGLVLEPATVPDNTPERGDAEGAETSCMMTILPSDLDHSGHLPAERLVSSFSNGGQVAWALIGATAPWLRQRGLGRVVLEMKFNGFHEPVAGAILHQTSRAIAIGDKTYRFGHRIEDAITKNLYATGEVLSVLMDMGTRRSIHLDEELSMKSWPR